MRSTVTLLAMPPAADRRDHAWPPWHCVASTSDNQSPIEHGDVFVFGNLAVVSFDNGAIVVAVIDVIGARGRLHSTLPNPGGEEG